jgi:uncharacterized protein (TIGR02058 family)
MKDPNKEMFIHALIACPSPETVDKDAVLAELPFGKKTIEVKEGGMTSPGLYVPQLGDDSPDIVVANASIIVSVSSEK